MKSCSGHRALMDAMQHLLYRMFFLVHFILLQHAAAAARHHVQTESKLTRYLACFKKATYKVSELRLMRMYVKRFHNPVNTLLPGFSCCWLNRRWMEDSWSCVLHLCLGGRLKSGLEGMWSSRPVRSCSEPLLSTGAAYKLYRTLEPQRFHRLVVSWEINVKHFHDYVLLCDGTWITLSYGQNKTCVEVILGFGKQWETCFTILSHFID